MNAVTLFGASLRMVFKFIDTRVFTLNIKSVRVENVFYQFYQYISRMTESEILFMYITCLGLTNCR